MKNITIGIVFAFFGIMNANAQTAAWAHAIGGEDQGEVGTAIKGDALGNTYVAGMYRGEVKFDPNSDDYTFTSPDSGGDVFVEKFDINGDFLWAKVFNTPETMELAYMDVDADGNVYLSSNFRSQVDLDPGPGEDIRTSFDWYYTTYVVKLDTNGNYVFGKTFESLEENGGTTVNALALAPDGGIVLGGNMTLLVDFDPGPGEHQEYRNGLTSYLAKLDADGDFQWVKLFDGNFPEVVMNGIRFDSEGNIITAGAYMNKVDFNPGPEIFELDTVYSVWNLYILKLDADGNFIWVRHAVGQAEDVPQTATTENVNGFDIDSQDNILFTGFFDEYINFEPATTNYILNQPDGEIANAMPIFLAKMDKDGNMIWARSLEGDYNNTSGSAGAAASKSQTVDFNEEGDLYMGITVQGSLNYEIDDAPLSYDSGFAIVAGFVKIDDENGDIEEAYFINSDHSVFLGDMTASGDYIYATGSFFPAVEFDEDTAISATGINHDAFAAKFSPVTLSNKDFSVTNTVVYPNPASTLINIETNGLEIQTATLTDILGKVVKEITIFAEAPGMSLEGVAAGTYLLRLEGVNGSAVKKIIVE